MRLSRYLVISMLLLLLSTGSPVAQEKDFWDNVSEYYGYFSKAMGVYKTFLGVADLFGLGSSMDEKIIEEIRLATNEIKTEINDAAAYPELWEVRGYLDNYKKYCLNPSPDMLHDLDYNGARIRAHLEGCIHDRTPRVAFLASVSYNTFMPIYLTVLKAKGGYPQEYFDSLIESQLNYNLELIGPYAFSNVKLPFYRYWEGKLWFYFGGGIWQKGKAELLNYIWDVNEELKDQIYPDYKNYKQGIFYLKDQSTNGYFYVDLSNNELKLGHPPTVTSAAWKFTFQNTGLYPQYISAAKISHSSGLIIDAIRDASGYDRLIYVYVRPDNHSPIDRQNSQVWMFLDPKIYEEYPTINKVFMSGLLRYAPEGYVIFDALGCIAQIQGYPKLIFDDHYTSHIKSNPEIRFIPISITSTMSGSVIYVDANNTSGKEDGTKSFPYNTVAEGINGINPGSDVLIAPGRYLENMTIQKNCSLIRNGDSGSVIIGKQ